MDAASTSPFHKRCHTANLRVADDQLIIGSSYYLLQPEIFSRRQREKVGRKKKVRSSKYYNEPGIGVIRHALVKNEHRLVCDVEIILDRT